MNNKFSKQEIEKKIEEIFSGTPSPQMIKKVKRLAMSKNIKIKDLRKKICKKCYSFFDSKNCQIRIKKNLKIIKCKNCGNISRYKLK